MRTAKILVLMVALFAFAGTSHAWFLDFEWGLGHNYELIQSGIPGMDFGDELYYLDAMSDLWNTSSYDLGLEWNLGEFWIEGYVGVTSSAAIGRIDFDNADASFFTVGYSSFYSFTLEAYDINDNLLSFVTGPSNLRYINDNDAGMGYLTVATGMSDIAYVTMGCPTGSNSWIADNMSGDASGVSSPIPEPTTMALLGLGLIGMGARLRKRMK